MSAMFQFQRVFKNRVQDVLDSRGDTVLSNLKIFFEFLNSDLLLKSILGELAKNLPDPKPLMEDMKTGRRIILPSSYLEKVKTCLSILRHMVETNEAPYQLMFWISGITNSNVMTREALKEFFVPVCNYIDEKIGGIDAFQYLLVRFKLKTEWFEKGTLYCLYKENTSKGEDILDRALRSYLFDEGINFPFSKPSSPSGEVDVLSFVEKKPIPLEIKVFDGESRSQSHIRQGLIQAFSYAKDYGEPSAYLVIFNVSECDLVFKLSSAEIPQRLVVGDKTIYIFTVNLYIHEETASKRDLKQCVIEEKYLLET
jgi:hypothetical protein